MPSPFFSSSSSNLEAYALTNIIGAALNTITAQRRPFFSVHQIKNEFRGESLKRGDEQTKKLKAPRQQQQQQQQYHSNRAEKDLRSKRDTESNGHKKSHVLSFPPPSLPIGPTPGHH